MAPISPVFIVGTERSGSNLLRLILNQLPSLAIPHPPHLLKELAPLEARYGDLAVDENFRRLVDDAVRLVELHFSPWDVAVDRDRVFAEAPERGVYGVKAAIYDQYCRAKGKPRWGCKSTFVIRYVDRVLRVHPAAKFIHLVRDGRDVAASARSSVFNHFHPYYVARLWSQEQALAADLSRRLPGDSWLTVRYEDLLDDPAAAARGICAFIGGDYSDSLLHYFESEEARSLSRLSRSWENCGKPVMSGNRANYKRQLSAKDVEIFEREAFRELKHFGYGLENAEANLESGRPGDLARAGYWGSENALAARAMVASLFEDENSVALLRKRLFVLKLRLTLPR